jgi:hypothetical protein
MDENPVADMSHKPKEYRELPCKLSDDELRQRGDALATLQGELETIAEVRKASNASLNARAKATTAQMERLGKQVRERQELRSVEVRETLIAEMGQATTTRVDTGEEVGHRAMTEDEKQGSLFLMPDREKAVGDSEVVADSDQDLGLPTDPD